MNAEPSHTWVGRSIRRVKDPALVRGQGHFTGDLKAKHAVRFVRSSLASGRIVRIGKPAGAVLCFDAGSHLYMYNSGYNPAYSNLSVGIVSKALVLQWAIEHGKTGLDFLRGDEPYKYEWGARDEPIQRLLIRRTDDR